MRRGGYDEEEEEEQEERVRRIESGERRGKGGGLGVRGGKNGWRIEVRRRVDI